MHRSARSTASVSAITSRPRRDSRGRGSAAVAAPRRSLSVRPCPPAHAGVPGFRLLPTARARGRMREPPLNLRALPARPRARCEFGEFISASPEAVCALFAVACIRSSQAFLLALGLYKLTNSHPPELSKGRAAGGGEG